MTGRQDIHQIEFRWQPGRDFSALAHSFTDAAATRRWAARLAGLARPATPELSLGVPSRSVVYQAFPDGSAAVVWRRYDAGAIALHDATARRPLAARAVIADAGGLWPHDAMALCAADYPGELGPAPGHVEAGGKLAPFAAAWLTNLTQGWIGALDERSRRDAGLDALVAAALRNQGRPLSVVLPAPEMASLPERSAQIALLWGLWQTTAYLCSGTISCGAFLRTWSFSTYEPPLGDTETTELAHIVFRSQEQERQPQSIRPEVTVRPRYPASSWDNFDVAASVLANAYRHLGGFELGWILSRAAQRYATLSERINAVTRQLAG